MPAPRPGPGRGKGVAAAPAGARARRQIPARGAESPPPAGGGRSGSGPVAARLASVFTGIVEELGEVVGKDELGDSARFVIRGPVVTADARHGDSIAVNGVCLTVVERGGSTGDAWFDVDLSGETVSRTVPGMWNAGASLNIEPSLRLGDELGGHIVTGHVDAVGRVTAREEVGGSIRLTVTTPAEIAPFIAAKGSITVDGVSLTVNAIADHADGTMDFELNIIPHTAEVTTIGTLKAGDAVNLEIDVLARYLQRMQSLRG